MTYKKQSTNLIMHASSPSTVQNSMAFYYDDLPPGYRFRPDAEQLLDDYLRPMLEGEDVPYKEFVPFCDLYGDQEPWQIWDEYFKTLSDQDPERTDLYFITKHKMKTPKGKRVSRSVGRGGTWKGDDAEERVYSASRDRKVIGKRKRFHYENKGSSQHGRWLMHEFKLDASLLRNKRKANDYVLCILRKKIRSVKKNSDQDQENQEEDDDEMSVEGSDDQQDGDLLHEPKFLPEPELAKEQTRSTDTQESYDMRKNAMEIEVHQANEKNDTQQREEHQKRVMQFQAYLMKQIAHDQAKRKNSDKDSQKMSLEEMENLLMSDD